MSGFREKSQEFFGSSPISIFDLEACLPRSKSQEFNTFKRCEDTVPWLASSSKSEGAVRQGELGAVEHSTGQEGLAFQMELVEFENTARPILTSSTSSFEDPAAPRRDEQVSILEVLVKTVKIGIPASAESLPEADSMKFSCRRKLAPRFEEREHAACASAKGLETRELSIRKRRFQPLKRLILNHRSLNIAQTGVTVSPPRTLLPRGLPSSATMHAFFDSEEEKRSSARAEFQSRWNFDSKMGLPKLGPWEWTPVSAG
ncbi:hypothetical protein CYMTET_30429 [Cymbomonas tetramitiformis]|uniref:Cyclin-dependent kinase inhibitor domain-containing protein n=1 Tax=Cymbomonas tetramitiformis TaxID=36881 RepID=A0AAE0FJ31_9CHLO|nr:hypothetical protein CYMTET_30429 [Cymbomonas tetramitiformis]